jgi:hypothetical protein
MDSFFLLGAKEIVQFAIANPTRLHTRRGSAGVVYFLLWSELRSHISLTIMKKIAICISF